MEDEIKRRIAMAKSNFADMSSLFKDRKLSMELKVRLLKGYIWSVISYGCESWTLTVNMRKKLEAAEMWFHRRMLHVRVPYTSYKTNESVLRRAGQTRQLLKIIDRRQLTFLGHSIRKGELEDLCLSGKISGKKARGGQRRTFLDNFKEDPCLKDPRRLWNTARCRKEWQSLVHRGPHRT